MISAPSAGSLPEETTRASDEALTTAARLKARSAAAAAEEALDAASAAKALASLTIAAAESRFASQPAAAKPDRLLIF